MADDRATDIEMIVDSVRVHMRTGRHVLVLRETDRARLLMIWVGVNEANAIAMKLQGVTPERPLTHDLMVNMLEATGIRLDRIIISDLADETFHARLVLVGPDSRQEVDARPSDSIALAVRTGAPIFATVDVLDRAATTPDAEEDDEEEGEGGAPRRLSAAALEETGEPIDAARLDIFREFVNSLDMDQDRREGGSTG
ncbi:MAG TPA: bifunctional nuclease family protein [Candidatus Limnocylindrales bacterium]|nr:bifunctional nuclease family protein [Candidatus Limnocylindrales bacterium]